MLTDFSVHRNRQIRQMHSKYYCMVANIFRFLANLEDMDSVFLNEHLCSSGAWICWSDDRMYFSLLLTISHWLEGFNVVLSL